MTPPIPPDALAVRNSLPAAPLALGGALLPAPPVEDRIIPPADAAALATLAENAWAPNTRRAYGRAWRSFEGWCRREGRSALPATVETVAIYVGRLVTAGKGRATLDQRLAAIAQRHALVGYDPPPTAAQQVKHLLRSARRSLRREEHRKAPVALGELEALLAAIDETPLVGKRDRALLLVGFFGALRRSELVAIEVAHVRPAPGGIALYLPHSKTDQEGEGETIGLAAREDDLCPVRALEAWLAAAKVEFGPVFRTVWRSGRVAPHAICDRGVARIVKRAAWKAGVAVAPEKGERSDFSGHSLRAGLVTQGYRDGIPEAQIAATSRHKSMTVMARYRREADPVARGASGRIGRKT